MLELLGLAAKKGDTLTIQITGGDEEQAGKAVEAVLKGEFNGRKAVGLFKIAFFGTKDYDRTFFSELVKDKGEGTYNSDIRYFSSNLGPETVNLILRMRWQSMLWLSCRRRIVICTKLTIK